MMKVGTVLLFITLVTRNIIAFTTIVPTKPSKSTTTKHFMSNYNQNADIDKNHSSVKSGQRRIMFGTMMGTILGVTTTMTIHPSISSATYSAYARREEDWQQRVSQNSVQVSTPKLLRDQLREIAPMNEERSRIFCPNGPSAAVTPLMENRCSDLRQATPSVYGRSQDVVGNSIPGFSEEWTSSIYSSNLPEYGFTKGRK